VPSSTPIARVQVKYLNRALRAFKAFGDDKVTVTWLKESWRQEDGGIPVMFVGQRSGVAVVLMPLKSGPATEAGVQHQVRAPQKKPAAGKPAPAPAPEAKPETIAAPPPPTKELSPLMVEAKRIAVTTATAGANGVWTPATAMTKRGWIAAAVKRFGLPVKTVEEAVEAQIVEAARGILEAAEPADPRARWDKIVALYENQPTLSARTSETMRMQAYSTPVPLAYALTKMLGVGPATTLYDATAGHGMLAIGATKDNAFLNELDETRAGFLESLKYPNLTREDATEYVPDQVFDVVHLNPPFGSMKETWYDGYKVTRQDHLIAMKALKTMADNGVAAIITGAEMIPGKKGLSGADAIFVAYLNNHYYIADHFEVEGALYRKQGASFPLRVIVLAGRKAEPTSEHAPEEKIVRVNSWDAVYNRIEGTRNAVETIRDDLVAEGGGSTGLQPGAAPGPATPAQPGGVPVPRPGPARPPRGGSGGGRAGSRGGVGPRKSGTGGRPLAGDQGSGLSPRPSGIPVGDGGDATGPVAPGDRGDVAGQGGRGPGGAGGLGDQKPGPVQLPRADTALTRTILPDDSHQVHYTPLTETPGFDTVAPRYLAEPMERAAEKLRQAVTGQGYPSLDEFVREKLGIKSTAALARAFSGEQLVGVALAIHQTERGKALIIGDETGIGKGRQAAGYMEYARNQGWTPIFITADAKLFTDMHRDMRDIGAGKVKPLLISERQRGTIVEAQKHGPDKIIQRPETASRTRELMERTMATGKMPAGFDEVVYVTYSQFQNQDTTQEKFMEWLATNRDVVFVLDEAHMAGGQSTRGIILRGGKVTKGSGEDKVETEYHGLLRQPRVRGVLYLSATFAKRADTMALYFKTSLGDALLDVDKLEAIFKKGGVPLQQAASAALGEEGQMIRRERAFTDVPFNSVVVGGVHKEKMVTDIDAATFILRNIVEFSNQARAAIARSSQGMQGTAQTESQLSTTAFASVVHNQLSQLLLGMKADSAVAAATEAFKNGQKPIITVQNTMGSFIEHYAEEQGLSPGQQIDAEFGNVMKIALNRTMRATETLPTGGRVKLTFTPDELGLRTLYDRIVGYIDDLDVDIPASPIDYMKAKIEQAGIKTGELTARKHTIKYHPDGRTTYEVRSGRDIKDKNTPLSRFNDGTYDALIINQAGSQGLSAHASPEFKDVRPRHMFTAQPHLNIDVVVQTFGRIRRSGMIPGGAEYTLLQLPVAAERRPTAVLTQKLKKLNANVTAAQESDVTFESLDFMNKYGDGVVAQMLADNPELAAWVDLQPDVDGQSGIARATAGLSRQFTGRLSVLPNAMQEEAYAELAQRYNAQVELLKAAGVYDLELEEFSDWDARLVDEIVLEEGTDESSMFHSSVKAQALNVKETRKPPQWREVLDRWKEGWTDEDAAARKVGAMITELEEDAIAYIGTRPEPTTNADSTAQQLDTMRMNQWEDRQRILRGRTRELITDIRRLSYMVKDPGNLASPGVVIWTMEQEGAEFSGVITNIGRNKSKTGSPMAPSRFYVDVMVNNGSRSLRIPFSQVGQGEGLFDLRPASRIREKFEAENTGDVRDRRWVLAGNPLKAFEFAETGRMINFTRDDGSKHMGVLMPRYWSPKLLRRDPRKEPRSGAALLHLFENYGPWGTAYARTGDDLRIFENSYQGNYTVTTPASRSKGGKYFLDTALTDITGTLEKRGSRMTASISRPKMRELADYLIGKGYPVSMGDATIEQVEASNQAARADRPQYMSRQRVTGKVDSPEFKRWFGDWQKDPENASKVVDAAGKPLVVYHGTMGIDFATFGRKPSPWPTHMLSRLLGNHFAEEPGVASTFSGVTKYQLPSDFQVYTSGEGGRPDPARSWYVTYNTMTGEREVRYDGTIMVEDRDTGLLEPYQFDVHGSAWTVTSSKKLAWRILPPGGRIYPVYLNIRNPIIVDNRATRGANDTNIEWDDSAVEAAVANAVFPVDLELFIEQMKKAIPNMGGEDEWLREGWQKLVKGQPWAPRGDRDWEARSFAELAENYSVMSGIDRTRLIAALDRAGVDGVRYNNTSDSEVLDKKWNRHAWIAIKPEQTKSATGNRGTWSPDNPDITYAAIPPPPSVFTRAELEGLTVRELRAEARQAGVTRLPLQRDAIVDTLLDHGGLENAEAQIGSATPAEFAPRKRGQVHAEIEARSRRILAAERHSSLRSVEETPAEKRCWRRTKYDAELARTPEFRRLADEMTRYGVALVPVRNSSFLGAQRGGNIFVDYVPGFMDPVLKLANIVYHELFHTLLHRDEMPEATELFYMVDRKHPVFDAFSEFLMDVDLRELANIPWRGEMVADEIAADFFAGGDMVLFSHGGKEYNIEDAFGARLEEARVLRADIQQGLGTRRTPKQNMEATAGDRQYKGKPRGYTVLRIDKKTLTYAAKLLETGIVRQVRFDAFMAEKYGEGIRPYLEDIWRFMNRDNRAMLNAYRDGKPFPKLLLDQFFSSVTRRATDLEQREQKQQMLDQFKVERKTAKDVKQGMRPEIKAAVGEERQARKEAVGKERQARRAAVSKEREARRDLELRIRDRQRSIDERRQTLKDYANKHLPLEARGRINARLARPSITERTFRAALEYIDKVDEALRHRAASQQLIRAMKEARVRVNSTDPNAPRGKRGLRPEYRERIRALIDMLDASVPREKTLFRLRATRKFFEDHAEIEIPDRVRDALMRLDRRPIAEMDLEDIDEYRASLQLLLHLNDYKNKLIFGRRARELRAVIDEGLKGLPIHGRKIEDPDSSALFLQPRHGPVWKYIHWYDSAEYIPRLLDGREEGPLWRWLYKDLDESESNKLQNIEDGKQWIRDRLRQKGVDMEKDFYSWSHIFPGPTEEITIQSPAAMDEGGNVIKPARTFVMTRGTRVSMYLTTLDRSGYRSLLSGLGWSLVGENGPVRMPPLDVSDVTAILDGMTDQEKALADAVYDFFQEWTKAKINTTSVELMGFELATVESYYPKLTITDFAPNKPSDQIKGRTFMVKTLEGQGFLKGRLPRASKPIVIDDVFTMVERALTSVSAYAAYAQALRNAKTILNWQSEKDGISFREEVRKYHGGMLLENLKTVIARIEDNSFDLRTFDSWVQRLVGRGAASILAARPTVWVKQSLSLPLAALELDLQYLPLILRPPGMFSEKETAIMHEIIDGSPQLRNRVKHGRISRDVGDMLGKHFAVDLWADRRDWREKMATGTRLGDRFAIMRITLWAHLQARGEMGKDAAHGAVIDRAIWLAEKAVRATQPTWDTKDRSLLIGDPNPTKRMFTMFQSFLEKTVRAARMSTLRYAESDHGPKAKAKFLGNMFLLFAVVAALNRAVMAAWHALKYRRYRDEDEEKSLGKKVGDQAWLMAEDAISRYWLVGHGLAAASRAIRTHRPQSLYNVPIMDSPPADTIRTMIEGSYNLANAVMAAAKGSTRGGEKQWRFYMRRAVEDLATVGGRLYGIPLEGLLDMKNAALGKKPPKGKEKKRKLEGKPRTNKFFGG
jgi:hypothetical protein